MEAFDTLLTSRMAIHTTLQRRLQKYQSLMKCMADTHRRDLNFVVDDWVYVKLRPYRQTFVQPTYSKMSKRFYGPFQVQDRVGVVAYRLQLPIASRIHNVFHVSHHGPILTEAPVLPSFSTDNHPIIHPLRILDWKTDDITDPPTQHALVQWHGFPLKDTTWELWLELKALYDLEDKVCFPGEGIDSNNRPISQAPCNRPTRVITKPKYLEDYV